MPRYRKIAITLPAETLREIEARRFATGESRSALVRRALGLLLEGPDRVADGEPAFARASAPDSSRLRSREERLELFDAATRRIREREGPEGPPPASRGWTREDLHDRDRPG